MILLIDVSEYEMPVRASLVLPRSTRCHRRRYWCSRHLAGEPWLWLHIQRRDLVCLHASHLTAYNMNLLRLHGVAMFMHNSI